MKEDDDKKLEVALECMEFDNPRSVSAYIESLMSWDVDELLAYREKRKKEAGAGHGYFRPHP